jgi:hypothetical protein
MGNCIVSVHVTGAHHNGRPDDIDQIGALGRLSEGPTVTP